jgi:L-asparaginase
VSATRLPGWRSVQLLYFHPDFDKVQSLSSSLVVLATGGTIAGRAGDRHDNVGYQSAQLGVADLLQGLTPAAGLAIEGEQVAQLDSKDLDGATWQRLAQRVAHHLARSEVRGIVITHGTDTLEETAWLLHRVLAPGKPVVLTAAMRPATSLQADGPQNLADALLVAAAPGASGVVVVVAGQVFDPGDVRKRHTYRLDAFGAGDAGPIAAVEQSALRRWRPWPEGQALGVSCLAPDPRHWPWVDIVTSHAAARAEGIEAWVRAGVRGIVVAGTGNGTVHHVLAEALERARHNGVAVRLVSRCATGPVIAGPETRWPSYPSLGAPQARVELMLELMQADTAALPERPGPPEPPAST